MKLIIGRGIIRKLLGVVFLAVLVPEFVSAQASGNFDLSTPASWGLGNVDLKTMITRFMSVALGFLGTLMVLIFLYGGFLWMTSMGNDEKVGRAKRTIMSGIMGAIIILMSYAIASFVLVNIQSATTG